MIQHYLDINAVFFTLLGYPMSYIEFFGTVFNIWCVWLAAKNRVLNWPIGIVGIVLYIFLFYQIRLYSDLFEQFYFLVMSFYGWWMWTRLDPEQAGGKNEKLKIKRNTKAVNIAYVAIILAGTFVMGHVMKNINLYLPAYFPEPASFPYLDAFTTVMSFAATILMARKKVECWYLWILVDVIGIWLYWQKGVKFIALEYVLFLVLATKGMLGWLKDLRKNNPALKKIHEKGTLDRKIYAPA
jgi:nicotinamide mononucleotide transporter